MDKKDKTSTKKVKICVDMSADSSLACSKRFSPNTPVSLSSSALSKFQFDLKRTNPSVPRS